MEIPEQETVLRDGGGLPEFFTRSHQRSTQMAPTVEESEGKELDRREDAVEFLWLRAESNASENYLKG